MKRFPFSQEGSIAVVIAFLLPIMLLMVALIVNINQLVFTKIKLQNTVDACALSAAAVQAAGLNEIADLNREMQRERDAADRILRSGPWRNYGQARRAGDFFYNRRRGVIDYIRRYQERENARYAIQADHVARHVKDMNLPQSRLISKNSTGRLANFRERPTPTRFFYYTRSYSEGSPRMTLNWRRPGTPMYVDNRDGRRIAFARRTDPQRRVFLAPERVAKTSPTYVHYELYLPSGSFALAGGIFGVFPELRAEAVAKPAGGHVYRGEPQYRAVLVK